MNRFFWAAWVLMSCLSVRAQIPSATGTTLSGDKVSLPGDLRGEPAVLVLGFSKGASGQAATWGKRLAADFHDQPEVHFYEMPMLSAVPKFLRGFVVKKIAQDVSDNGKKHFLPLYDHEPEWRAVAGVSNADDAYIVLVDGDGRVRWKAQGALSESSDAELRQKVNALRHP